MGIRGLYSFLKPIRRTLKVKGNERVGVDGNYILYRTYGDVEIFIRWLEEAGVTFDKVYVVFDGGAAAEKEKELEKRREGRATAQEKAGSIRRLLEDSDLEVDERGMLEKRLEILERAAWRPTKEIQRAWKQRFEELGVRWEIEKGVEADKVLGRMSAEDKIDAVISGDMDMFLLGIKEVWVPSANFSKNEWVCLRRGRVLDFLGMTGAQFRDFAIMVGLDERGDLPRAEFILAYHWIRRYGGLEGLRKVHPEFWEGFENWERVELLMGLYPVVE